MRFCVLQPKIEEPNNSESLKRLSQKYPKCRIAMEVGQHSPWTSRLFEAPGNGIPRPQAPHPPPLPSHPPLRAVYHDPPKCAQSDAYKPFNFISTSIQSRRWAHI